MYVRVVAPLIFTLALAACSSVASTSTPPSSHPALSSTASASSSSGYPKEAADTALCATYQALTQGGDFPGVRDAVAGAGSTVTRVLATDMLRVADETGTIQQDEMTLIRVDEDCAIAQAGSPPVESSP